MTEIYKLQLSNKSIDVFIERKKIKNYYIKISPDLKVVVPIPIKQDINIIYNFIEKNKNWIEKNINKFKDSNETFIKDNLCDGGTVKILDNQYIVFIHKSNENKIVIDGFNIDIYSKNSTDINYINKQYEIFLKGQATIYFQNIINKFLPIFKKYNVLTPTLKVKFLKSKWGSCLPHKALITLNLHLYKTSAKCIEYVIFHELTHLVHSGHKKRFYAFLEKYLPDYKQTEKVLDFEASQLLC